MLLVSNSTLWYFPVRNENIYVAALVIIAKNNIKGPSVGKERNKLRYSLSVEHYSAINRDKSQKLYEK